MAVSFVLVHGASHGAWCWDRVVPLLADDLRVTDVLAIDLPGHGETPAGKPIDQIHIADYVRHIVDEVLRRDLSNVILVGHSLAGVSIPHAAAELASRMQRVVYLATSNPEPGKSVMDLMQHETSPVSRGIADDPAAMFCNDLDAETTAWLLDNLCEEPPAVLVEPVERAWLPVSLPTTYVVLEQDATLDPAYQLVQAENARVDEVVRFDSGHSAFAAKPRELAELLLGWA